MWFLNPKVEPRLNMRNRKQCPRQCVLKIISMQSSKNTYSLWALKKPPQELPVNVEAGNHLLVAQGWLGVDFMWGCMQKATTRGPANPITRIPAEKNRNQSTLSPHPTTNRVTFSLNAMWSNAEVQKRHEENPCLTKATLAYAGYMAVSERGLQTKTTRAEKQNQTTIS